MARYARIESVTGIYHVMLRGINRQNIFESRGDYYHFKTCLEEVKAVSGLKVFAYCLMSNHAHILAGVGTEPLGTSFKRVGVRYAVWYNRKYNRQGQLFQNRYKSEPITDESYLLAAVRYLHQNPVKAKLCRNACDYEWSSYIDYVSGKDGLCDTETILGLFSESPGEQIRLFEEFSGEVGNDAFIDIDEIVCISDDAVREKMSDICGAGNVAEFQALPLDIQKSALLKMRKSGMSIRQIVRHTGASFGIVRGVGR